MFKWLFGGALASFTLFGLSLHFGKVDVHLNFGGAPAMTTPAPVPPPVPASPPVQSAAPPASTPGTPKEEQNLEGEWNGDGVIYFAATGTKETAHCRARYSRKSKDSYVMQTTCVTGTGKATQTGTVHLAGENRYRGNFHNAEYGTSGTIYLIANGDAQSLRLTSNDGYVAAKLAR